MVGSELGTQRWTVRIKSSNSPNSPTDAGRREYPPFDINKPNTLQWVHMSGRTCAHGCPRAAALSTGTLCYPDGDSELPWSWPAQSCCLLYNVGFWSCFGRAGQGEKLEVTSHPTALPSFTPDTNLSLSVRLFTCRLNRSFLGDCDPHHRDSSNAHTSFRL